MDTLVTCSSLENLYLKGLIIVTERQEDMQKMILGNSRSSSPELMATEY